MSEATRSKKKSLNLSGSNNEVYDLDKMARTNSDEKLIIHIHKYKKGESPNPENPVLGQIWISQLEG